jgi:hypothetical protein
MTARHEGGECKVCVAASKAGKEDHARIDRKLATLKTNAARIEFLLRELRTQKTIDAEGRIRTLSKPATARGRKAKNIARILRVGKRRLAEAKAKGIDISVLPPESKIRKRVEADWNRRLNPPPPRGNAGRLAAKNAATTTKRKSANRSRAIALRAEGKTVSEIAATIRRDARTVRRYLNRH